MTLFGYSGYFSSVANVSTVSDGWSIPDQRETGKGYSPAGAVLYE